MLDILFKLMFFKLDDLKNIVDILGGILTAIALLVGGVWTYLLFVKNREKFPRANVSHRITHRELDRDKKLLVVDVGIQNSGKVLLSLESAITRVQRVMPLDEEIARAINQGEDIRGADNEVPWPQLDERKSTWKEGEFELEPGETDWVTYDFVVDTNVQIVRVYTYFQNVEKRERGGVRPVGWALTTTYDLKPAQESSRTESTQIQLQPLGGENE